MTDTQLTYQVPPFTIDPAFCDIVYTYTVKDGNGDDFAACSNCFDPATQLFTFHYDADLGVSGPDFIDYTVEVTGTAGVKTPTAAVATFNFQVKNPCIDPAYVTIETKPLVAQNYILYDPDPPATGAQWTHDAFVLNTVPVAHSLCGGFTYEATFMGAAVGLVTAPMSFDTATRTYTFYSEDYGLIGIQPYTLEAHLTDYPVTATVAQAEASTITIIDPCLAPDSVVAPAQMTVPAYLYTGAAPLVDFTMAAFDIFPPTCIPVYSCQLSTGAVDICSITEALTTGTFDD